MFSSGAAGWELAGLSVTQSEDELLSDVESGERSSVPHRRAAQSEEELFSDVESGERSSVPHRRAFTAALGALALVATCVVALVGLNFVNADAALHEEQLTALKLFDHPEMHEVATQNILKIGNHMMGGVDPSINVRRLVEEAFRNTSRRLAEVSPDSAVALDKVIISQEQKAAMVHMMQYLSDPRVQRVGLNVAHAVRDAASDDNDVVKRHVAHRLASEMTEIRSLHEEMFPTASPMRELLGMGGGFEHLLDPKTVSLMKTTNNGWDTHFNMIKPTLAGEVDDEDGSAEDLAGETTASERRLGWFTNSNSNTNANTAASNSWYPSASSNTAMTGYSSYSQNSGVARNYGVTTTNRPLGMSMTIVGLIGAALSESTVLLRIMKPLAKMFHNDINVPPMVTSGLGASNAAFEIAACELNGVNDNFNPIEILMCPMEFASEGFDACRELFTLLGLLGDNNPANGRQGNHNGHDTEHYGILDDN